MENASKALLIAGAILIVILLIAVGMMIYNSATGTIDEGIAQMSDQEKMIFNGQFTAFEGTRVSGNNIKALIEKVNANNAGLTDEDAKFVTISGGTIVSDESPYSTDSGWASAGVYQVVITTDANTGLVKTITIS